MSHTKKAYSQFFANQATLMTFSLIRYITSGAHTRTLTCHPGTPPGDDLWQRRSSGSENVNDEREEAHHPDS